MAALDPLAQRVEDEDDHDRGEDDVQVHGLELAELDRQKIEDERDEERDRRRHQEPRQELVEVEQPLVAERLREEEEEDDGEHRADGRPAQARGDEPGEVEEAGQRPPPRR